MTEEEALEATEAFARDVARRAMDGLREVYSGRELCKHANPVACFAAIHSGLAAALMLGYDVGRAQALAERRATMISDDERREVARRLRDKKAECEERGYPWMCDDLILALGYDHDYEAGDEIFDRLADLIDPDGADPGPRDLARAWGWK